MALNLTGELKNGRVVRNIADGAIDPDDAFTGWTAFNDQYQTYSNGGYNATFTLDANAASQRSFLSLSVPVTSGKFYAFRMKVSGKSGTFARENIDVVGSVVSSVELNNIENGERAVIVEASATGNITFRVGFGIDNNDASATDGATFTISNVQIEELPAGQSVPSEQVNVTQKRQAVGSPLYNTGNNRFTVGFARDVLSTLGSAASGGLLTESYSDDYTFVNNFSVSCITDSFGDENDEFVRLYETANPDKFVNANSFGGARLSALSNSDIDSVLLQGSIYNSRGAQSGILLLQRCLNDIIGGDDLAADVYAKLTSLSSYAKSQGIPVIVATCPPFGDYSFWSAAREAQALAYNVLVAGLASSDDNVYLLDVFDVMNDPGTFDILAAYDSGDGLHPSSAGSAALAAALEVAVDSVANIVIASLASGAAPRAVTYIPSQTAAATSSAFTVQPSQELEIFAEPRLGSNEYVTLEVNSAAQGWRTMGTVINQDATSGVILNNKRVAQEYRVTKSATELATRIESN